MIDLGLIGELLPYSSKISKALGTVEKLMADPDVKEAIATAKQVADIVAAHQQRGKDDEKTDPGTSPGGAIG